MKPTLFKPNRHHFELAAFGLLAVIAALTVVLLARGSHPIVRPVITPPTNTPHAAVVDAKVVNRHVCDPKDYVMTCALPQASVATITRGVDPVTQGVDFGWSCPVSVAKNFGASYLSYDTSKDWTLSCINAFHAEHKGTVAVFEAGANDAQGGYNLGYSQAKRAAALLVALHAPSNQPFDMAIDCDCSGASLVGYFKGANAAEPGRINAYGGYYQLLYLSQHHLVGHLNWQTYAWSGGRWLPASIAPLEQYLNSSQVDYDRAIAKNYGQFPPPKPPVPLCSRTMCYKRFANETFTAHTGKVCRHGCREATLIGDWQKANRSVCISVATCAPQHSYRLWVRYRVQWLERRLAYVSAHSTAAVNKKLNRPDREHIEWAIGFEAAHKSSYNAYVKFPA